MRALRRARDGDPTTPPQVSIDGISRECDTGRHFDCTGCKDPCHPRGTQAIIIRPSAA